MTGHSEPSVVRQPPMALKFSNPKPTGLMTLWHPLHGEPWVRASVACLNPGCG